MQLIGTNLDFTVTSTVEGRDFGLRERSGDDSGNCYIYAVAGAAIGQYDVVAIDEAGTAQLMTKALADAGHTLAAAQIAVGNGEYAWFQTSGVMRVNGLASCAADVPLYTTATAGSVDDLATSQTKVKGLVLTTAIGGSAADAPALASIEIFADI